LAERLISSGIRFDSILVSAATGKPESFARYGAQLHMTAISGCAQEQLQQTLAWMQQAQAKCTAASWRVVLAGESEQLTHAIHWLAQTAKAHLSQEVQVLGTLSVERLSASLVGAWTGLPELTEVLKRHLLTN
jgi:malonyl CoA-acyl carrier protein transacylase